MFNMSNVADKLSCDSKNIKLDTTVNPTEIQMDIMKKASKCQSSFSGACMPNCVPQNSFAAYPNQQPMPQQYQYPSAPIPPQAYQGQYVYNYSNWQQPNVQNAYAMQQNAYNQQMAQAQMQQIPQMQGQIQAPPVTNPAAY